MPRRIAFINEKGGSGKTTLVANLAAHLCLKRGRRVLGIDMDPQGHLGKSLGIDVRAQRRTSIELLVDSVLGSPDNADPHSLPSLPTRIANLDIVVSNKSLALYPAWAGAEGGEPTSRLAEALAAAPEIEDYDYVMFDAPPSFGSITLNILRACDEVVIPVPLTYLALEGSAEMLRTRELVRTRYGNPGLRITMVIATFHRRTRLAAEILGQLERQFPKELASTVVGYHVKIDEAQSRGRTIFEYAPGDRGAHAMAALAEELEARGDARTQPDPEGTR
jgi:chromosome partitioning protein